MNYRRSFNHIARCRKSPAGVGADGAEESLGVGINLNTGIVPAGECKRCADSSVDVSLYKAGIGS